MEGLHRSHLDDGHSSEHLLVYEEDFQTSAG